jgi:hypothetical protein
MDLIILWFIEDLTTQAESGNKSLTSQQKIRAKELRKSLDSLFQAKFDKFMLMTDIDFMRSFCDEFSAHVKDSSRRFNQQPQACGASADDRQIKNFEQKWSIKPPQNDSIEAKTVMSVQKTAVTFGFGYNCPHCGLTIAGTKCERQPDSYHI